jgi:hypothetical protein
MANESYIYDQITVTSTDFDDLKLDIGGDLKRPATSILIKNYEGYASLTGDVCVVKFNNSSSQVFTLSPGETLTVEFAVWQLNLRASGSSGANDCIVSVIAS